MQQARPRSNPALSPVVSLAGFLSGLGLVALVLMGIVGTIYKLVADDGLIAGLFGRSPSAGLLGLGMLLVIGVGAWLTGLGSGPRQRMWLSNALVYGSALVGCTYLLRYWWTGLF